MEYPFYSINDEWRNIAQERNRIYKQARYDYKKHSLFDDPMSDVIGTYGELAVRQFCIDNKIKHTKIDLGTPKVQGDAGYDLIIRNQRVDVKTNKLMIIPNSELGFMVPMKKIKEDCDEIVAVVINPQTVGAYIIGKINKSEFLKKATLHYKGETYKSGKGYYLCDTLTLPYKEFRSL